MFFISIGAMKEGNNRKNKIECQLFGFVPLSSGYLLQREKHFVHFYYGMLNKFT